MASHVKKRRRGCLGGCLLRIVLLLGLAAALFVGACVLGFVQNDPETGAPSLNLESVGDWASRLPEVSLSDLPSIDLPDVSGLSGMIQGVSLPGWAYGVSPQGLTVKTLRAGEGEAVLVCADGYTMLLGGGSGMGAVLCAQLLLCGVNRLDAVVAMSSEIGQIGGLPLVITLMPPQYLLLTDTQTKGTAYNRLVSAAQKSKKIQAVVPSQGQGFDLGRARVTVIGPIRRVHTDERDDGLSIRVDYGGTSVLIMGDITQQGERELMSSGVRLDADALICARGGSEEATGTQFVNAVSPGIALMNGKDAANATQVRLTRAGAKVYRMSEHGTMTLFSDGQTITIQE